MDAAQEARDPLAAEASPVATPHPDSQGNPAWQRTLQMLRQVEAEEDARRRRN